MTETHDFQPGKSIAILGTSGCGKTFVAKRLAEILGVTYICSDAIYWGPDWTESPPDKRLAEYDLATRGDAWTFDGNVDGLSDTKGALILSRADTLVWLDLPRLQVFMQVLRRTIQRAWTGEPMWHNNSESRRMSFFSRDSILLWSMQTYSMRKKKYRELFKDPAHAHLRKLRLTSRKRVDAWLSAFERGTSS